MKDKQSLLFVLLLSLGVVAFCWPMVTVPQGIASGDAFRDNDWLNCRSFDLLSRQSIMQYGQFPLRSHLIGGGFPVTSHPSDGSWAPTILAVLLFGDVLGVKVNLALLFLAGTFGVYALARRWLGIPRPAAALSGLAFTFSAWAPSMLLVGFYHQAFYLLVPLILYFLLQGAGRLDRLLWAGLLLCFLLQQGGHAFAATAYFLGLMVWLQAAYQSAPQAPAWRRWGAPLGVLAVITTSLAFAKGLRLHPHLWGHLSLLIPAAALIAVGMWTRSSPRLRAFWPHLWPWIGRLAVALGAGALLGAARVVGTIFLSGQGSYHTGLDRMRYWFMTQARDEAWVERFYEGPGDLWRGLVERVPRVMSYGELHGRQGGNIDYEYAFLGLTAVPLALVLVALVLGRTQKHVGLMAACGVIFSLICLGWFVPPDFHFMLVWGVPWAGDLSQPLKYYNFFLLLPLVLMMGVGAARIASLASPGWGRSFLSWGLLALLALPFIQNRPILGELFAIPRPAPAAKQRFHQVAMVSRPSMVPMTPAQIHQQNEQMRLRDFRRPREATEYYNIRRGVGTVDWYGTVTMAEAAIPARYITPSGQELANPRYRGEAWTESGSGEVLSLDVRPNTIEVEVDLVGPDTVVVNQSYLSGFSASTGVLKEEPGLLHVFVESAGRHRIQLSYRPPLFIAGLALSGISLLAWVVAQVILWRRRRSTPR